MIAAHREMETLGVGIEAPLNLSHSPPVNISRISVLLIARDHAALTSYALRHIEVKTVLLARLECPLGNQ
jgi:hypothetical protein